MARKAETEATPALTALSRAKVAFTVRSYEHDQNATSFGLEAAELLGLDPRRVYKTLLVEADGRIAVGIVPVSGSLDLKAIAWLEDYLRAYKGAVVVVSHDFRLLDNVAKDIFVIENKRATRWDGSILDYKKKLASQIVL